MSDNGQKLYTAASSGDEDEVSKLLQQEDADIDFCNTNGSTPLYMASLKNHPSVVDILIKAGADVSKARTTDGLSPLYMASRKGHDDIVESLLKAGADVNLATNDGDSSLYIASHKGFCDIVQKLIDAGAEVNQARNDLATPLLVASHKGHLNVVNVLVQAGADLNPAWDNGGTPLIVAAGNGHGQVVAFLLRSGADVSLKRHDGDDALAAAKRGGHDEIVDLLGEGSPEREGLHNPSLLNACLRGYELEVRALLLNKNNKADVNFVGRDGSTPLYAASEKGHAEIVELLVKAGAKVNGQTKSPLHAASREGHVLVVKCLVKAGADVNVTDTTDETASEAAKANGHYSIVNMLQQLEKESQDTWV